MVGYVSVSEDMVWSGVRVDGVGVMPASARIAGMVAGSEVLVSDCVCEVSVSGGVGDTYSRVSGESADG